VVSSSAGAGAGMRHSTTHSRGPLPTLPFRRELSSQRNAVRTRGFAPAPLRGKDHSDAVVSPSPSFVPGSCRSKAVDLVRRFAGSTAWNASALARRRAGVWRAASCRVRGRNTALPPIRRRNDGPAIRWRPIQLQDHA
jgi:hypothetical protein